MMMTDARVMSIDELKAFLASSDVLHSRETLGKRPTRGSSIPYVPTATSLAPGQRKDMRSYMQKMTGISGCSVKDSLR